MTGDGPVSQKLPGDRGRVWVTGDGSVSQKLPAFVTQTRPLSPPDPSPVHGRRLNTAGFQQSFVDFLVTLCLKQRRSNLGVNIDPLLAGAAVEGKDIFCLQPTKKKGMLLNSRFFEIVQMYAECTRRWQRAVPGASGN